MINWRVASLLATAVENNQYPRHDLPEVALVGRSNVGKSSLINHLISSRLARTSNTPGRTQTLNFYAIDGRLCFVDLPGYGYARVPKKMRQRWGPMIEHYLTTRPNLIGVLQVVDIRHAPSADDKSMAAWLVQQRLPAVGIATKADKISRGRRRQHVGRIARELGLPVVAFSSVSGVGRDDVIGVLQTMLLEARLGAEPTNDGAADHSIHIQSPTAVDAESADLTEGSESRGAAGFHGTPHQHGYGPDEP